MWELHIDAYREDVDEVMAVLKEVGVELRRDPEFALDMLDDLEINDVDDFAASQVTIRIRSRPY
jgi:small conductance mechanosensitive channel